MGGGTLHDLADEFGVSAERTPQIEVKAFEKMRAALSLARPKKIGSSSDMIHCSRLVALILWVQIILTTQILDGVAVNQVCQQHCRACI